MRPATPVGAGAGGPKGSLAPADPSSVAEGIRCGAWRRIAALLRFAQRSTHEWQGRVVLVPGESLPGAATDARIRPAAERRVSH